MDYTAKQFERLSKWAQQQIESLQRQVRQMESDRTVGPEGSNTFLWNVGVDASKDTPLGTDRKIIFYLSHDRSRNNCVEVTIQGEVLHVYSPQMLRITPWAANVAYLFTGTELPRARR